MARYFLYLLLLLSAGGQAQEVRDTTDCLGAFFKKWQPVRGKTPVILVDQKKKTATLSSILKRNSLGESVKAGLLDLDRDGNKELLLYQFTGGAHCCDIVSIYVASGNNRYALANTLFAGNTCIYDSIFVFNFYESFGYFFTCYACDYSFNSKLPGLQYTSEIRLRFRKDRLEVIPGTATLLAQIKKNLSLLTALNWDGGVKTEGDQDDGRRKDVALNLAVYYYSFGRDLPGTRKLFENYYKYRDARKVWSEFSLQLERIRAENTF